MHACTVPCDRQGPLRVFVSIFICLCAAPPIQKGSGTRAYGGSTEVGALRDFLKTLQGREAMGHKDPLYERGCPLMVPGSLQEISQLAAPTPVGRWADKGVV